MYKFTFIILFLASTTTLAKTPQQYCQSLEQRQSGSFEILNMGDFVSSNSINGGYLGRASMKFCSGGRFCYGTLKIENQREAEGAVADCIKSGCLKNIKNGSTLSHNPGSTSIGKVIGSFVCNN